MRVHYGLTVFERSAFRWHAGVAHTQGPPVLATVVSPDARGVLAPGASVALASAGKSERPGFPKSCFSLSRKRCQPVSTN